MLPEAQAEPGSRGRVLRNLLGITRVRDMQLAESQALHLAQTRAIDTVSENERFTAAGICSLHRLWLGPIYAWAAEYRGVNLGKGGFQFATAAPIPGLMENLERSELARLTPCRPASDDAVAAALAIVHAELILIHPFSRGKRTRRAVARASHGTAGRIAAAGFLAAGRARQARLHRGNPRRDGPELRQADRDVPKSYRPNLEDCFFQWSMSACAVAGCQARRPNGWRMPSIAEEVLAEIRSAALARPGDFRKGLDFASFTVNILPREGKNDHPDPNLRADLRR
jgi:fido (protein-threonine AMPylation protein)